MYDTTKIPPRPTTWVEERTASRIHIGAPVREVVRIIRVGLTDEANSPAMRAERHNLMRGVLLAQLRYRDEYVRTFGRVA